MRLWKQWPVVGGTLLLKCICTIGALLRVRSESTLGRTWLSTFACVLKVLVGVFYNGELRCGNSMK